LLSRTVLWSLETLGESFFYHLAQLVLVISSLIRWTIPCAGTPIGDFMDHVAVELLCLVRWNIPYVGPCMGGLFNISPSLIVTSVSKLETERENSYLLKLAFEKATTL
jgi:hypothetical protein